MDVEKIYIFKPYIYPWATVIFEFVRRLHLLPLTEKWTFSEMCLQEKEAAARKCFTKQLPWIILSNHQEDRFSVVEFISVTRNGLKHRCFPGNCVVVQKQPPKVFYKKVVLKHFAKFTGKPLCQSSLLNKKTSFNFNKKETPPQVFYCEFFEVVKNIGKTTVNILENICAWVTF